MDTPVKIFNKRQYMIFLYTLLLSTEKSVVYSFDKISA